MAEPDADIGVEVAYATPQKQLLIALQVPAGTTALAAAEQSGIADEFDGLDIRAAKLGIFGKVVKPDQVLQAGDRIEIYRPLLVDPKQVRKERAARIRKQRGGA